MIFTAPKLITAALLILPLSMGAVALSAPQNGAVTQAGVGQAPQGRTLQDFQSLRERRLLAADTNGDGKVSKAEFLAAKTAKGDPAKRFVRLDGNGDGVVDKAEIDAMVARRFTRLDTDGDGLVTPQERAAGGGRAGDAPES